MGAIRIREMTEADGPALLETWTTVFGRARSYAEWEWAFFQNPAGMRSFVAEADGRIVGQYAGIPFKTWAGGRERYFVQSVDSMVHPDYRRGLKRPGLFVNIADAFFEHYGKSANDALYYGWPLKEAWRIGKRFLRYRWLREELVLVRELGREDAECLASVELLEEFGEDARWLYERCAGSWGAGTVRDEEHMRWRFLEHPTTQYSCMGLRGDDGLLRGLAVLREGRWAFGGALALVDWLVPDDEPEVARRLEAAVRARGRELGADRLVTLFPVWSGSFAFFQDAGWRVHPSAYDLGVRFVARRFDQPWLQDNWWLQLSDSDLV